VDDTAAYDDVAASACRARDLAIYELLRLRLVRTLLLPAPAAGTDWTTTVPAGVLWELLMVQYEITTSAAVANRNLRVEVRDENGNGVQRYVTGASVTATQTVRANFGAGIGTNTGVAGTPGMLPTPPPVLLPQWTLRSLVQAIDAGDQLGFVALTVREWQLGQVYWTAAQLALQLSHETPTALGDDDAIPATLPGQPAPPAASQSGWPVAATRYADLLRASTRTP